MIKDIEVLIKKYKGQLLAQERLVELNIELEKQEALYIELESILKLEKEDLKQFEDLPLKLLFGTILKNETEQYQKEKQEYLLAVLNFNECIKVIELLNFEKSVLTEKIEDINEVQKLLTSNIHSNKIEISSSNSFIAERLLVYENELLELLNLQQEVFEVNEVCAHIQKVLIEMIQSLQEAKKYENWGQFYREIQEGKIKRQSYIDKAQHLSYLAKKLILSLQKEVEDIRKIEGSIKTSTKGITKNFNTSYYENLILDWVNHQDILLSLESIESLFSMIQKIIMSLAEQTEMIVNSIAKVKNKQDQLIMDLN